MNMQGMDIQSIRRLSAHLADAAGEVQNAVRRAEQLIHDANWIGQDRDRVMNDWLGHRDRLLHVARLLEDASRSARNNADQQQRKSDSGDGGGW